MDGAWALYEAWVKIQTGDADTALVYAYGKSSPGDLRRVLSRQLDPYYDAPLWPDSVVAGRAPGPRRPRRRHVTEEQMAEIVAASRRNAKANPHAQLSGDADGRGPARRGLLRLAAAQARLPADHRRRRRRRPRRRRRRPRADRPPGVDPGHRPPHRAATRSASATSPRRRRPRRPPRRPASPPARSTSPSCTRRSPTRSSSCARPSASATTCRSTRRAARWPPTR